jgi:hypothetical protein
MTDLPQRMVEAAALSVVNAIRTQIGVAPELAKSLQDATPFERETAMGIALPALRAALALAEAEGVVLVRVPERVTEPSDYRWGWNACRAATLAGRVTL